MAYGSDMAGSAKRHLKSALKLHAETQPTDRRGCRAVSGYLFGLAGELAVKQMMLRSGMTPNANDKRNDPFFAHFPSLRSMLADTAHGRLQGVLKHISESKVFENWSTEMRYAPTSDIQDAWVERWKVQATDLVIKLDDV